MDSLGFTIRTGEDFSKVPHFKFWRCHLILSGNLWEDVKSGRWKASPEAGVEMVGIETGINWVLIKGRSDKFSNSCVVKIRGKQPKDGYSWCPAWRGKTR